MSRRMFAVAVVALSLLAAATVPGWAAPSLQGRAAITYPSDGMTLGGIVDVRGIATHPNINFYQLRYAPGSTVTAETQWVDFAIVQGASVDNDVLASWDTTTIPNGPYVLALAVWGVDEATNTQSLIQNLIVDNTRFVPTPEQETPTPEPLPTAEAGPTSTPVSIEQPATPTPRPTATIAGGVAGEAVPTATAEPDLGIRLPLSTVELRDAFCTGGGIAALLLLLWALYLLLKAAVRYLLRRSRDPRFF